MGVVLVLYGGAMVIIITVAAIYAGFVDARNWFRRKRLAEVVKAQVNAILTKLEQEGQLL